VTALAPVYDPLTIRLTKHLACGHQRTDGAASRLGETVHCVDCRNLIDVISISLPPGEILNDHNLGRLLTAGYTLADIDELIAEQAAAL
jgi:hypothetical protein